MSKHIQIVSDGEVILDKTVDECFMDCPCFDNGDMGYQAHCKLISMLGLEPNWVCDADYCKAWCPLKEVK